MKQPSMFISSEPVAATKISAFCIPASSSVRQSTPFPHTPITSLVLVTAFMTSGAESTATTSCPSATSASRIVVPIFPHPITIIFINADILSNAGAAFFSTHYYNITSNHLQGANEILLGSRFLTFPHPVRYICRLCNITSSAAARGRVFHNIDGSRGTI